jgi:hypothetical protein
VETVAGWKNDDLVLFHGCTEESLRPNNANGMQVGTLPHHIDVSAGSARAEFGQGFYTTTWLHQAKSWANLTARKVASKTRGRRTPRAVVLRFEVSRDELAGLDALVFTSENAGFWPFVSYSRSGSAPHGRTNSAQPEYDVVYGPVSIWPQRLIIKDADQASFHTTKAIGIIPMLVVIASGNPYIV